MGHVNPTTTPCRSLDLVMINLCVRYKVPTFTRYGSRKANALEVDNFMRYINLLTYLLTYLKCIKYSTCCGYGSLKVIGNVTIQWSAYDFLRTETVDTKLLNLTFSIVQSYSTHAIFVAYSRV